MGLNILEIEGKNEKIAFLLTFFMEYYWEENNPWRFNNEALEIGLVKLFSRVIAKYDLNIIGIPD